LQISSLPVKELVVVLAAYVLGCLSTGYYLVRLRTGLDIRKIGSGSTGATNVGRLLGRTGFSVTLSGDFLKGGAAIGLALYFELCAGTVILVMLAVVAGHILPVQLGLHGGKGLATALGAMLVFDYRLAAIVLVLTGLAGILSRQFTLGLIAVIATTPVLSLMLGHTPFDLPAWRSPAGYGYGVVCAGIAGVG
jgi:glycerol-3-phosphate acyltransferase PlsY